MKATEHYTGKNFIPEPPRFSANEFPFFSLSPPPRAFSFSPNFVLFFFFLFFFCLLELRYDGNLNECKTNRTVHLLRKFADLRANLFSLPEPVISTGSNLTGIHAIASSREKLRSPNHFSPVSRREGCRRLNIFSPTGYSLLAAIRIRSIGWSFREDTFGRLIRLEEFRTFDRESLPTPVREFR